MVVYDTDEQHANDTMDGIHQQLLSYHQLYDIYNTYDGINNLATVNANAGLAPVKVDDKILRITSYNVCYTKLLRVSSELNLWRGAGKGAIHRLALLSTPGCARRPARP